MKVKDIIKLMDNRAEVFIFTREEYFDCYAEREFYDECPNWTEENGCGDCDLRVERTSEWGAYTGIAERVPIKLSEKRVIKIDFRERDFGKGRKRQQYRMLGIQVAGGD